MYLQLKGVLKRNVNEFSHRSSPVGSHRTAIKTSTPDTDDAKCREISSRAAGAAAGKHMEMFLVAKKSWKET